MTSNFAIAKWLCMRLYFSPVRLLGVYRLKRYDYGCPGVFGATDFTWLVSYGRTFCLCLGVSLLCLSPVFNYMCLVCFPLDVIVSCILL